MADKLALQEIIAEYKLKDLASKDLLLLQKAVNKSVKDLTTLEKEAAKAESFLGKLGKTAKGTGAGISGVASGAGTVAQKPIGTAESVISSGVGGALMAIPVVGGLLSAFLGSVGDISDKFTAGVILQKSLNKDLSTINRAFKGSWDDLLKGLDANYSTITEQRATFAKLSGAGVEAGTLTKAAPELQLLAKAQGVELKDVLSTRLEVGKGLNKAEISVIEAWKTQLGNMYVSDIAMQMITKTLKNAETRLQKSADENMAVTGKWQKLSVGIDTQEQALKLQAVTGENLAKSQKAYALEVDKRKADFFVKSKAAGLTTTVTGAIRGETDTRFQDWQAAGSPGTWSEYRKAHPRPGDAGIPTKSVGRNNSQTTEVKSNLTKPESEKVSGGSVPKRAAGGDVKKSHTYQINENEQEYFTPGQNGRINTAKQMAQNIASYEGDKINKSQNNTITFAPVINIHGDISGNIRQEVEMALNNVAKKIAYNQGMKIPG